MNIALVLGGTHDHIYLINLLKSKNYYIILIDYLDNPPAKEHAHEHRQISILDEQAVLKYANEKKASLVIATCIDQALATAAFVSEQLGLPCHISHETALNLTNKSLMKIKMRENGIPTSEFTILQDLKDITINSKLNYPLVIKPVDANSSKGVYKINCQEEIKYFFEKSKLFSKTGKVIIEEYVEGIEISIDLFICNKKSNVVLITENIKSKNNPKSFTIVESRYDKVLEDSIKENVEGIANKIVEAFKIKSGPLLLQCIFNKEKNKISVIEFSNRIGGGSKHHFIKTLKKFDILASFVDIILGGEVQLLEKAFSYKFALIKYLYTEKGVVQEYKGFEKLKNIGVILDFFIYKTPESVIQESLTSSDRCAGLLYVDNNERKLKIKEYQSLNEIEILNEKGDNILLR